jgi:hypothetical protein
VHVCGTHVAMKCFRGQHRSCRGLIRLAAQPCNLSPSARHATHAVQQQGQASCMAHTTLLLAGTQCCRPWPHTTVQSSHAAAAYITFLLTTHQAQSSATHAGMGTFNGPTLLCKCCPGHDLLQSCHVLPPPAVTQPTIEFPSPPNLARLRCMPRRHRRLLPLPCARWRLRTGLAPVTHLTGVTRSTRPAS